jgi:aminoglycoside phosphotransferase (APT) family kinase protein
MTFDPVPFELADVVDPTWLSTALGQRYAGCRVAGVEMLSQTATIASKLRLQLSYAEPGVPAAPERVYVKGYFGEGANYASAGYAEAQFYRRLADGVDMPVPEAYYVGIDEETARSVLLLEDLVRPRTALRTALDPPFTPAESAATLQQLAGLHASTRDAAALGEDWLSPRMTPMADRVPAEHLQRLLDQPRGEGIPDRIRNGRRVRDAMLALGTEDTREPCLLHGDTHAGNIYLTDGLPGLYDWQTVQRGSWALDVSYHIAAVLEVADRRQHERDLLEVYLDRRAALSAPVADRSIAMDAYRRHLAYGYFLWSMTQYTDEAITTVTVRRLGQAVADHDTFGLLGV